MINELNLTDDRIYEFVGKMISEMKYRKFPYDIRKAYIDIARSYLKSGKRPDDFLSEYRLEKGFSRKTVSLALKLLHDRVLPKNFSGAISSWAS